MKLLFSVGSVEVYDLPCPKCGSYDLRVDTCCEGCPMMDADNFLLRMPGMADRTVMVNRALMTDDANRLQAVLVEQAEKMSRDRGRKLAYQRIKDALKEGAR